MRTRRTNSGGQLKEIFLVDTKSDTDIGYGRERGNRSAEPPTNYSADVLEGTTICDEVWYEMCLVAKILLRTNPDADFYDLFNWVREEMLGGQEYGEGLLRRVDREIATELGAWN